LSKIIYVPLPSDHVELFHQLRIKVHITHDTVMARHRRSEINQTKVVLPTRLAIQRVLVTIYHPRSHLSQPKPRAFFYKFVRSYVFDFHICILPTVSYNGKVRFDDMDLHVCVCPAVSNTNGRLGLSRVCMSRLAQTRTHTHVLV
jgi:hypothetical protein